VAAGSWSQLTNYTVSANLIYKDQQNIKAYQAVKLSIFGPPYDGSVVLSPMTGMVGDNYSLNVTGWVSLMGTKLYYSVYTTMDSLGATRGAQVNTKPIAVGTSFSSSFKSVNPI